MNIQVIRNALGSLDQLLSEVRAALWQVEGDIFGGYRPGHGTFEYPDRTMEAYLQELYDVLLVVLEAAEMAETRASLVKAWVGFASAKNGLRYTDNDGEFQASESPALTFLDRLTGGLRMAVGDGISSEEAWTLNRLEAMLRDTAALVHRRQRPPADEQDLQKIMHDYLSAAFPDFRQDPKIGGTLKNFKPDCGIASVGAAIEFKIVHTKEQVAVAFSGVTEDSSGYKGSKDWTRYYAVVYQAQPFALESHFQSDMKRIGAVTWKAFVVNGPTKKMAVGKKARQSGKRVSSGGPDSRVGWARGN